MTLGERRGTPWIVFLQVQQIDIYLIDTVYFSFHTALVVVRRASELVPFVIKTRSTILLTFFCAYAGPPDRNQGAAGDGG